MVKVTITDRSILDSSYSKTRFITNAANSELTPGGGICGAIFDHLSRHSKTDLRTHLRYCGIYSGIKPCNSFTIGTNSDEVGFTGIIHSVSPMRSDFRDIPSDDKEHTMYSEMCETFDSNIESVYNFVKDLEKGSKKRMFYVRPYEIDHKFDEIELSWCFLGTGIYGIPVNVVSKAMVSIVDCMINNEYELNDDYEFFKNNGHIIIHCFRNEEKESVIPLFKELREKHSDKMDFELVLDFHDEEISDDEESIDDVE